MTNAITALGLMSGTSLDGIDGAFLNTDGERIIEFGPTAFRAYTDEERAVLRAATEAALKWQVKGPKPDFTAAETVLHTAHVDIIEKLLADSDWSMEVTGMHGQTVLHHPATKTRRGKTLQLVDNFAMAQFIRRRLGAGYLIYDFRTADIEAGGQGAPLAPIYHKALCEHSQLTGISAVLNLGGVGNVTLVGDGLLKASDTGPANGPLDQWMQQHGHDFDKGGAASLAGEVDFARVERWLARDFFKRPLPRSADRYDFDVLDDVKGMSLNDGAATLAAYCVHSVGATLSQMNVKPDRLILCGGGRHNKAIALMLTELCSAPVMSAEDVGWDSDMIEAQAFAYLAVRYMKRLPISFPDTTGVQAPTKGGKMMRCC